MGGLYVPAVNLPGCSLFILGFFFGMSANDNKTSLGGRLNREKTNRSHLSSDQGAPGLVGLDRRLH